MRSGQNAAISWIAFCLFGLGVPLTRNLVLNHPLLRFSEARGLPIGEAILGCVGAWLEGISND